MARIVFTIACVLVLTEICKAGNTANYNSQNRVEIPWHLITPDIDRLFVQDNKITEVHDVPQGTLLESVLLQNNLLTEFPDLLNLSSTLTKLKLGKNLFTTISHPHLLKQLVNLQTLTLTGCPLLALPDATFFPPKLDTMDCSSTQLTKFPNMCKLKTDERPSKRLHINQDNVNFTCDSGMLWTRLAYRAGLLSVVAPKKTYSYPVCAAPGRLENVSLELVDIQDFMERDVAYIAHHFEKLANPLDFFCYPLITGTLHDVSKVVCGVACLGQPGCAMFAFDRGQCTLSEFRDGQMGVQADFHLYQKWYII